MIVLGVDTATPGLSAALVGPTGVLASFAYDAGRRHTELLAPAIADLCRAAAVELDAIDALAVDIGPGLFTGLRVGLATVSALSSALGRPAVGLTSTEILADPLRHEGRDVLAVVDVRRSEVAWAYYPQDAGPQSPTPMLATPEQLAETLAGIRRPEGPLTLVGDGALRYRDVLAAGERSDLVFDTASPYPSASVAATIARRRLLAGSLTPGPIAPVYLRQADVRIGWASHDQPPGTATHTAGRPRLAAEHV